MMRVIARILIVTLGLLGVSGALASAAADGVRIGVNVGVPAPVVVAPPPVIVASPVVVVPPPTVITPWSSVYFYGGTYYTFHNGAWFVSPRPRGPWGHFAGAPPWGRHERDGHWRSGRVGGKDGHHHREAHGRRPKH